MPYRPHTSETQVPHVDISNKLWNFSLALFDWTANPPGGDQRITAYAEAVNDEIIDTTGSDFIEILESFFLSNKPNEPLNYTYKANLLLRALQKQALSEAWQADQSNPRFPHKFDDKVSWRRLIQWISDDSDRVGEFLLDVTARDVTSNIPKRYKSIPLVIGLLREAYPDRFASPPTIKDNGCSQNLGLIWLASDLPTGSIGVVARTRRGAHYLSQTTKAINELLQTSFQIGQSVGIDKVPQWDSAAQAWTTACSYYPSEFLQAERMQEDKYLRSLKQIEKVKFVQADFTKPESMTDIKQRSFDVDFHSVSYYLLARHQRNEAQEANYKYVKPSGLAIGQEFAYLNRYNKLSYFSDLNATPYRLGVFVTDMCKDEPVTELFGRWQTGRCTILELGPLALRLLSELRIDVK